MSTATPTITLADDIPLALRNPKPVRPEADRKAAGKPRKQPKGKQKPVAAPSPEPTK